MRIAVVGTAALSLCVVSAQHQAPAPQAAPVSLLVLLDVTTSVRAADSIRYETRRVDGKEQTVGIRIPDAATVLEPSFVTALHPTDRVRVARLGRTFSPSAWLGGDSTDLVTREIASALRAPLNERTGPSPIWDIVDEAVESMRAESGQKHMFLLTDGLATGNTRSMDEVIRRAAVARVAVHVVETGWLVAQSSNASTVKALETAAGNLKRLAAGTGGAYFARRRGPQREPPVPAGLLFRRLLDSIHAGNPQGASTLPL